MLNKTLDKTLRDVFNTPGGQLILKSWCEVHVVGSCLGKTPEATYYNLGVKEFVLGLKEYLDNPKEFDENQSLLADALEV